MSKQAERPYHHGDLKRVLIETAQAMLHEERGWQFTLREVARRAGVSHTAPYKHFPDKEALLAELAALGFESFRATLVAVSQRPFRSARAELTAAAKAVVEFGLANPSLYRLMFSAEIDKRAYPNLEDAAQGAFNALLDILERGQERGAFKRAPVRGQAAACWALVHGLTVLAIDRQLAPQKVGPNPVDAAMVHIFEGLDAQPSVPTARRAATRRDA